MVAERDTTPPRPRGVTAETELIAMARYARHLEANETASKVRDGMSEERVIAARRKAREDFGVGETMTRLFSDPADEAAERR